MKLVLAAALLLSAMPAFGAETGTRIGERRARAPNGPKRKTANPALRSRSLRLGTRKGRRAPPASAAAGASPSTFPACAAPMVLPAPACCRTTGRTRERSGAG